MTSVMTKTHEKIMEIVIISSMMTKTHEKTMEVVIIKFDDNQNS
jgi:hypothetical protein